MERQILLTALAILAFGMALNLHLSLAVLRRQRMDKDIPAAPAPGDRLPHIQARGPGARGRQALAPAGQACALLFLSSKCDKCRAHLPDLSTLLPVATAAGLAIRIVSIEPWYRLRRFLDGTPLAAAAYRIRLEDYKKLNPTLTSPAYLFVDHEGSIAASGLIGDADWLGLRAQLAQAGAEEEAAA
jgi:hypothetical protein